MAQILNLNSIQSVTGNLNIFENLLPGEIKRVYYISNVPANAVRGKHRHHKTWQALICINGSCDVLVNDNESEVVYHLNHNSKCLILEPKEWHLMENFSENCILLVIANENYDVNDYIDEPYPSKHFV
jgi:dTDP-4-dehydrorhamnose 3,5-epimerase-like enzyme